LSEDATARIQSLPLEQLEALAEALLDFQGLGDLTAWMASGCSTTAIWCRKVSAVRGHPIRLGE